MSGDSSVLHKCHTICVCITFNETEQTLAKVTVASAEISDYLNLFEQSVTGETSELSSEKSRLEQKKKKKKKKSMA